MQYMLLIHDPESQWDAMTPDQQAEGMAAYRVFADALAASGAMVSANRLRPTATATTVRVRDGRTQVLDGPYAETKEQLGGYFIIEAPDLDRALDWAARCPGSWDGVVEVRPVWEMEAPQTASRPAHERA